MTNRPTSLAQISGAPSVSVVIPTCNRAGYLREAIQSVLNQTVEITEIIVVDDASDDDPRPDLAAFGDKVRVHRLATRSGANVARNRGIALARGDVIALLDDDDLWLPEKTEKQLHALADGAEASLCLCQDIGGSPETPVYFRDIEQRLRVTNPCGTSGLVATRTALTAEPFDPALKRGQDWDIFVRLAQRGALALVEETLYLRRVGHNRITTNAVQQSPDELYDIAAASHKHKAWLGKRAYNIRVATIMLSYISKRDKKHLYILASIRRAGLRATLTFLVSKLL